ncbi:DUF3313 family protein [Altererythrobacter sp.]
MKTMIIGKYRIIGGAILGLCAIPIAAPALGHVDTSWDGLVQVESKKMDTVYLEPYADFSGYRKVMFDKPEITFKKNWRRNQNRSALSLGGRVNERQAQRILEGARDLLDEAFRKQFSEAGYQVVTAPGPDVMRITLEIFDLDVTAPENNSPGISYTYVQESGKATLALEVRDSETGDLLGRTVDKGRTGSRGGDFILANNVSTAADFNRLFSRWARICAAGLNELKTLSPIDEAGQHKKD